MVARVESIALKVMMLLFKKDIAASLRFSYNNNTTGLLCNTVNQTHNKPNMYQEIFSFRVDKKQQHSTVYVDLQRRYDDQNVDNK